MTPPEAAAPPRLPPHRGIVKVSTRYRGRHDPPGVQVEVGLAVVEDELAEGGHRAGLQLVRRLTQPSRSAGWTRSRRGLSRTAGNWPRGMSSYTPSRFMFSRSATSATVSSRSSARDTESAGTRHAPRLGPASPPELCRLRTRFATQGAVTLASSARAFDAPLMPSRHFCRNDSRTEYVLLQDFR
jgi:hypothetical protein